LIGLGAFGLTGSSS